MMELGKGKKEEKEKKKRGRKAKNFKEEYVLKKDQEKFFVDLSKDKKMLGKVFSLLEQSNQKDYGREITFRDLVKYGLNKISEKDMSRIKELGLSAMDKIKRLHDEHRSKTGDGVSLEDFIAKRMGVN